MSHASLTGNPSLSPSMVRRIEGICDRFEAAWKEASQAAGAPPRIEDFLGEASEPTHRSALVRELVPLDIEYRRRRGEQPTPDEYQSRFPELGLEWLAELIQSVAAPARHAAEQPVKTPSGTHTSPGLPSTVSHEELSDQSAADRQPPIRVLGDYELLEQIGKGGMGVVYKAREMRTNRIVALKMIRDKYLDSPNATRRFQTEAEHAASLDHPNIVPI